MEDNFYGMMLKLGDLHPEHKPLTDEDPCPVKGDFQGVPMGEVPAEYLDWLAGQSWLEYKYYSVYEYIQNNRELIDEEISDNAQALGFGDGMDLSDIPF